MKNVYLDWIPAVSQYFKGKEKILSLVETGKGEGTLWLVQNFKHVVSIEYSRYQYEASWENTKLHNHKMITLKTIDNVAELDDLIINSLGTNRPIELKAEALRLYSEARCFDHDILFIDHGCHNRGEVLDFALEDGRFKYIIVHDINFPYYAYRLEDGLNGYGLTAFKAGQGTAIYEKMI